MDILHATLGGTGLLSDYGQWLTGGGAAHKSGSNDGVPIPVFCVDNWLCCDTHCR